MKSMEVNGGSIRVDLGRYAVFSRSHNVTCTSSWRLTLRAPIAVQIKASDAYMLQLLDGTFIDALLHEIEES